MGKHRLCQNNESLGRITRPADLIAPCKLPADRSPLQVFHVIPHFFGFQHLVDQHQTRDDLSDRLVLRGVDDSGIFRRCRQSKEIIVLGKDHATFFASPEQVFFIGSIQHTDLRGSLNVHSSSAKRTRNGLADVLVGMIANLAQSLCSCSFAFNFERVAFRIAPTNASPSSMLLSISSRWAK